MGQSTPKTTTTTQNTTPWNAGDLAGITQAGRELWQSGQGFNPYPGATYTPPTQQEMAGLNEVERIALSGNPYRQGVMTNAKNQMTNGGVSGEMRSAMSPLQAIASGAKSISTGDEYADIYQRMHGPSYQETYAQPIASGAERIRTEGDYRGLLGDLDESFLAKQASGSMIGSNNPYLMGNLATASQEAADAASGAFGGMGRYGSATHQGTLARETGNIYSQGLGAQMNQDIANAMGAQGQLTSAQLSGLGAITGVQGQNIGNRLQASGQMDAGQMARIQAQLAALGGQSQVEGANISNQAGAASSMLDVFGQGAQRQLGYTALAPQLQNLRYDDAMRLAGVGGVHRENLQGQLDSNIGRWNQMQQAPLDRLNFYGGLAQGATGNYGTTTETAQTPRGSALSGLLGGALAGAGAGRTFGPWGAGIGAVGGGLMGLFS